MELNFCMPEAEEAHGFESSSSGFPNKQTGCSFSNFEASPRSSYSLLHNEVGPSCSSGSGPTFDFYGRLQSEIKPGYHFSLVEKDRLICCGLCRVTFTPQELIMRHIPQAHPEQLQDAELAGAIEAAESCIDYSTSDSSSSHNSVAKAKAMTKLKQRLDCYDCGDPVKFLSSQLAQCCLCHSMIKISTRHFRLAPIIAHFERWHASHVCAGTWSKKNFSDRKALSKHDFAFVGSQAQCIWCAVFMYVDEIVGHFTNCHSSDVCLPSCSLCFQEIILNARAMDLFGEGFDFLLLNNQTVQCGLCKAECSVMEVCIRTHVLQVHTKILPPEVMRRLVANQAADRSLVSLRRLNNGANFQSKFTNTRLAFGQNGRVKQQKVLPIFRQVAPINSEYFATIADKGVLQCKLCKRFVYSAVISSACLRHVKEFHQEQLKNVKEEFYKLRMDKISQGCCEPLSPSAFSCLLCDRQYSLNPEYNLSRLVRHMRTKHSSLLPENMEANRSSTETYEDQDYSDDETIAENLQDYDNHENNSL